MDVLPDTVDHWCDLLLAVADNKGEAWKIDHIHQLSKEVKSYDSDHYKSVN